MKVITIKQPFASLIAAGIKEYEFRTWKTNYRGEVLIHAGKGIDKKAMEKFSCYNLTYPVGCIIAKAEMVDCVPIDSVARTLLKEKNELIYGSVVRHTDWKGFGFKLENIEEVEPIYIKGQLGLWNYDENINLVKEKNNV